jgi:SWI/SNF-related matrix-associated actin-dependent regulator 1 of chromatin subfamily A
MELYPYQKEGVRFLMSRHRAYLADEMGLGKTVQAIVATGEVRPKRVVVVCPASVVENWRREWALWGGVGELTVTSYSSLIRHPVRHDWADLVILDEAHYCKTPGSKRTKAALKLAAAAPWAWLLSGTPMPNDPRELYAVFKTLWPHFCDSTGATSAFKWMDRYCVWADSDYGYRVWGTTPAAKTELRGALRDRMLRRRLKDIALELPPLRFSVQYLDRDPNLANALEELGGDEDDPEHMSTMRRLLGQYKAPRIAKEIARELEEGAYENVVVLYHHRKTGEQLAAAEGFGGYYGFDGSTPVAQRQEQIDRFQVHGGIFLAQQTAAGIGITLTRAHEIVLVEPSWSPADNQQAIKRIHRIGQDKPCRARLFAVPESMDEALMNTLRRKSAMLEEVVDGET